jgi:hypothetical protein
VLIPALFRYVPATSRQHLPSSWEHARQKAQAYSAEHLSKASSKAGVGYVFSLYYQLHPHSLAAIWQDIQDQLTEPANLLYRDAKLFFSSKNTKLRFSYTCLSNL